jgi:hypothetical protein
MALVLTSKKLTRIENKEKTRKKKIVIENFHSLLASHVFQLHPIYNKINYLSLNNKLTNSNFQLTTYLSHVLFYIYT